MTNQATEKATVFGVLIMRTGVGAEMIRWEGEERFARATAKDAVYSGAEFAAIYADLDSANCREVARYGRKLP